MTSYQPETTKIVFSELDWVLGSSFSKYGSNFGIMEVSLICRPLQCGIEHRFRCDCNVYDHGWVPYWQIMGTKYKIWDIAQRHSRKQNPIKLEKFYFQKFTDHHTTEQNSDEIHLRLLNIEGFDAAISILFSINFNHTNWNWSKCL